jgi:hypothetical protein
VLCAVVRALPDDPEPAAVIAARVGDGMSSSVCGAKLGALVRRGWVAQHLEEHRDWADRTVSRRILWSRRP